MSRNPKEAPSCSRSSRGFTLAELLVALLVLSIMLALVGSLWRSFIRQTGKARYTYAERAMKFYWLNSAISSMFYYVIYTPERVTTENREFIEFFDGRPESMAFITNSPLVLKGVVLERIYFKEDAIYLNETPIFSLKNDYANPVETEETQQVRILGKVKGIRFTYLKRARRAGGPGQPAMEGLGAIGGPGAIGMPVGKAKDSLEKIVETDRLDGEIPAGVKLSVIFDGDRKMDYCFKVLSDFVRKKDTTFGIFKEF